MGLAPFFLYFFFSCLKNDHHCVSASSARDELFAYDGTSQDQRDAVMNNTDRLNRATGHLAEGRRVAAEAQDVAKGIMSDLHDQRETIMRARGRLQDTDGNLGKSQRVLGRIYERCAALPPGSRAGGFFFVFYIHIFLTPRPRAPAA